MAVAARAPTVSPHSESLRIIPYSVNWKNRIHAASMHLPGSPGSLVWQPSQNRFHDGHLSSEA
jgi:hypothetical protein